MKRLDPRILIGVLLLAGGGLSLMQAMGKLESAGDVFFGSIFLLAGFGFLSLLLGGHWWSVFPGATLLGIGALILLPDALDDFGGMIFLGSIALAFWVVYLMDHVEKWWALIPAGVLTTLAVVTVLPERVGGMETAGILFLGLAATFLLVAVLARMKWAFWPAAALGVMGFLGTISLLEFANYVWAVILIAAGAFLLVRFFASRS
jgi:hypothetical protein